MTGALELTRVRGDHRLYALEGVGTIRLEGILGRSAHAEANGRRFHFGRRGFWQRAMDATDGTGAPVGEFVPREIRRGGALRWEGRRLTLRPVGALRERYSLRAGDRELVFLDAKGWGTRPVEITIETADAIDPGLLLFAAFVVHQLAVKAVNAASAGSTAALSGTYSGG